MGEKHSPGPWRWSENRPMVSGAEGVLLDAKKARVLSPRGEPTIWVTNADARLIAAAPELAKELRYALDEVLCGYCASSYDNWANKARELLDRIDGD